MSTTKTTIIREPWIRIQKQDEMDGKNVILISLLAFFIALVAGGFFLMSLGLNPFEAYKIILSGAFSNIKYIEATIEIAIPLLVLSLGITLAFKMKFWNIGAEGQFIMGAIFASYFALFHNDWPHIVLLLVMFIAGFVGGGLIGYIPAYFKCKYGTNETLFTLMLNYIALYFITYFKEGPWKDPNYGGHPTIPRFIKNARLDQVFGIHFGWIIALLLVVIVSIYLRRSKHGYEISVVGESENTARYAGMNVKTIVTRTMFMSGGICGLAGMMQATGVNYTLDSGVASGVGFTAIIVAWLARLNPVAILIVSILLSILEKGSGVLESTYQLQSAVPDILQGIILFFVLGFDFFTRYKLAFNVNKKQSKKVEV